MMRRANSLDYFRETHEQKKGAKNNFIRWGGLCDSWILSHLGLIITGVVPGYKSHR